MRLRKAVVRNQFLVGGSAADMAAVQVNINITLRNLIIAITFKCFTLKF